MKGDHAQHLQKEMNHFVANLEKESSKLKRESQGQEAVGSHLYATWQKRTEDNMMKMNTQLSKNITQLQLKLDKNYEKMMADRVLNLNEENCVISLIIMLFYIHSYLFSFIFNIHWRMEGMTTKLDQQSDMIYDEKKKCCKAMSNEVAKQTVVE